jgi:diguanylate cyclase (GGDEF)-like protein
MTWSELSPVPRTYVASVTLIGLATIAWSLPGLVRSDHALLAVLFLLAIPISLVEVTLPGTASTISLSHVLGYLALFTLGTSSAVAVTVAGAWTQCTFRTRQRSPIYKTLFSIATLALAMQLSGVVYTSLGGRDVGEDITTVLFAFAAATTVFFAVNTLLVAGAIAVTTAQPIGPLWCDTFLSTWPAYLLGAAVAAGSHLAMERTGPWLVAFLTVPLAVAFHNLRVYLQRVDEASTDALTGLSNQRSVLAHGARELTHAARHGHGVTIVVADLDGLKSINDTYGHRAGDLVLRDVARTMRGCIGSHDVCARCGGDEFLVVLGHCDAAAAAARARRLQETVDTATIALRPDVLAHVGISIGTASYPDDGKSLEQLIETADARMYDDKQRRSALRHSAGARRGPAVPDFEVRTAAT